MIRIRERRRKPPSFHAEAREGAAVPTLHTKSAPPHFSRVSTELPTVVHVTHWKAGSQWLHRILHYCCSDRVVTPKDSGLHFADRPFHIGGVYPTVYMSKPQYDRVQTVGDVRPFVVIRDLRDTLVSIYFSWKYSHPIEHERIAAARAHLQACSPEDGLLWLACNAWFARCAALQLSWLDSGVPILKYEDLLENDHDLLQRTLLNECGLGVDPALLANAVRDCRFASITGRERGVEDPRDHFRKGVAGDWRNYFTPAVRSAFRERYADVLVRTGYESGTDW
jgi:lipopolysaccharide transport system ATP-binding protein